MPSVQCALPRLGRDLSREPLQAIVNVSNKAQLKQQIIRAQAKKDLDVYLEQQERIKARQAAEAFQVLCVCANLCPHRLVQSVANSTICPLTGAESILVQNTLRGREERGARVRYGPPTI